MRVAINQPSYLPWLGYFDLISSSDVFIFLDDVPFSHQSWRSRNRIRTDAPRGWSWLTIPVRNPHVEQNIDSVEIDNTKPWPKKHIKSIEQYYRKSSFFETYFPPLRALLATPPSLLCDLDISTCKCIMDFLGIKTKIIRSSDFDVSGHKSQYVLSLCEATGATEYYSPQLAKEYLDEKIFEERGIRVSYHDYEHPTYSQMLGPFVSHLSIIDLLFNEGPSSLSIIKTGQPHNASGAF